MIHGAQLSPSASDHNTSAAFQLAIWMVEYGAAFSFSGVSAATIDLAGTFIANVQTNGIWDCPTCTVSKLNSGDGNQTLAFGDVDSWNFRQFHSDPRRRLAVRYGACGWCRLWPLAQAQTDRQSRLNSLFVAGKPSSVALGGFRFILDASVARRAQESGKLQQ